MTDFHIVLGGSTGIGRAVLKELDEQGAHLLSVSRTRSIEPPGQYETWCQCDLRCQGQLDALIDKISQMPNKVITSCIFSWQAVPHLRSTLNGDLNRFAEEVAISINCHLKVILAFGRLGTFKKINRYVIITSRAVETPYPGSLEYNLIKSIYVQAFQTLRSEKKLHSALVFVNPGFVRTAAMESVLNSVPRELTNFYNDMNEKVGIEIEAAAKFIATAANGAYDHRTDIVHFRQR